MTSRVDLQLYDQLTWSVNDVTVQMERLVELMDYSKRQKRTFDWLLEYRGRAEESAGRTVSSLDFMGTVVRSSLIELTFQIGATVAGLGGFERAAGGVVTSLASVSRNLEGLGGAIALAGAGASAAVLAVYGLGRAFSSSYGATVDLRTELGQIDDAAINHRRRLGEVLGQTSTETTAQMRREATLTRDTWRNYNSELFQILGAHNRLDLFYQVKEYIEAGGNPLKAWDMVIKGIAGESEQFKREFAKAVGIPYAEVEQWPAYEADLKEPYRPSPEVFRQLESYKKKLKDVSDDLKASIDDQITEGWLKLKIKSLPILTEITKQMRPHAPAIAQYMRTSVVSMGSLLTATADELDEVRIFYNWLMDRGKPAGGVLDPAKPKRVPEPGKPDNSNVLDPEKPGEVPTEEGRLWRPRTVKPLGGVTDPNIAPTAEPIVLREIRLEEKEANIYRRDWRDIMAWMRDQTGGAGTDTGTGEGRVMKASFFGGGGGGGGGGGFFPGVGPLGSGGGMRGRGGGFGGAGASGSYGPRGTGPGSGSGTPSNPQGQGPGSGGDGTGSNPQGGAIGPGGPEGAAGMYNYFQKHGGTPGKNVHQLETPYGRVGVHDQARADVEGFMKELAANGAPIKRFGSFVIRPKAWGGGTSSHGFGAAFDIDDEIQLSPAMRRWIAENPQRWEAVKHKYHMGQPLPGKDPAHIEWMGPGSPYTEALKRGEKPVPVGQEPTSDTPGAPDRRTLPLPRDRADTSAPGGPTAPYNYDPERAGYSPGSNVRWYGNLYYQEDMMKGLGAKERYLGPKGEYVDKQTGTSKQYGETALKPGSVGWYNNAKDQIDAMAKSGAKYIELDNSDQALGGGEGRGAFAALLQYAGEKGLQVALKNPTAADVKEFGGMVNSKGERIISHATMEKGAPLSPGELRAAFDATGNVAARGKYVTHGEKADKDLAAEVARTPGMTYQHGPKEYGGMKTEAETENIALTSKTASEAKSEPSRTRIDESIGNGGGKTGGGREEADIEISHNAPPGTKITAEGDGGLKGNVSMKREAPSMAEAGIEE